MSHQRYSMKSGPAILHADRHLAPGAPDPDDNGPLPRRKTVFTIVSLALLMASIDQTVVSTALHSIQHDLNAEIQWVGWTITIYALVQVLIMPVAGKVSELHGRRRVFIGAAVIFTVASLLCGFADNIVALIILRAVQAIGGGAFMPVASGLISDHFGRNRDKALGLFTSVFPVGAIIGPIIGGIFVSLGWWQGIFFINVPVGIAIVILAVIFLPQSRPGNSEPLDVLGVGLLGAAILGLILGISALGDGLSPLHPLFMVSEAVAAGALVLFILHSKRSPAPFVPMELLIGRGFGAMNVINCVFGAALVGFASLVPLYAADRFALGPLESGSLLTVRAIAMIAASSLAVLNLRRTGHRLPIVAGFVFTTAGLWMMFFLAQPGPGALVWLTIGAGISGIGMGMAVPAANNATLHAAQAQVAAISGLRGMFRQTGAIVSISIASSVIARSADSGLALGLSFVVVGALLPAALPLLLRVPEHRGTW